MQRSKLECRAITEIRVTDPASRKIGGYLARYNSPSLPLVGVRRGKQFEFIETIAPGAFNGVELSDMRCMYNHKHLLGRVSAGTMRTWVDENGLAFECDLAETNVGNDVLQSVSRGDLRECSFTFYVKKDSWTKGNPANRTILEIESALEGGPVDFAAYPDTVVEKRDFSEEPALEETEQIENRSAKHRLDSESRSRAMRMDEANQI